MNLQGHYLFFPYYNLLLISQNVLAFINNAMIAHNLLHYSGMRWGNFFTVSSQSLKKDVAKNKKPWYITPCRSREYEWQYFDNRIQRATKFKLFNLEIATFRSNRRLSEVLNLQKTYGEFDPGSG